MKAGLRPLGWVETWSWMWHGDEESFVNRNCLRIAFGTGPRSQIIASFIVWAGQVSLPVLWVASPALYWGFSWGKRMKLDSRTGDYKSGSRLIYSGSPSSSILLYIALHIIIDSFALQRGIAIYVVLLLWYLWIWHQTNEKYWILNARASYSVLEMTSGWWSRCQILARF